MPPSQLKVSLTGMGVGRGSARGASVRNLASCKRERESAMQLSMPWM